MLRELGYRVSVVTQPLNVFFDNVNDTRRRVQVSDNNWFVDYPSASDFFDLFFRCSSWKPADPATTTNGSFFCDPSIDREMDLADSEEGTAHEQAAATWAAVDRAITDTAAWVPLVSLTESDFLSSRTTNYQYNPAINGVLLDQVEVGRG